MTSAPTPEDIRWLSYAINLSRNCPPARRYNVGAIIVGADGDEMASGYSRDIDPHIHAEESALAKVAPHDHRLATATIYSSLEPCTERRPGRQPCTSLILAVGLPRVVIAWREPSLFVADCQGVEQLREAGTIVIEVNELEGLAKLANSHLGSSS